MLAHPASQKTDLIKQLKELEHENQ